MSQYLQDFIDFFDLSNFYNGSTITVSQCIGMITVAFIGCIFTIIGTRCVFEMIKIVTDWRNF